MPLHAVYSCSSRYLTKARSQLLRRLVSFLFCLGPSIGEWPLRSVILGLTRLNIKKNLASAHSCWCFIIHSRISVFYFKTLISGKIQILSGFSLREFLMLYEKSLYSRKKARSPSLRMSNIEERGQWSEWRVTQNSKLGRKKTKYWLLEMRKADDMSGEGNVYKNKERRFKVQLPTL